MRKRVSLNEGQFIDFLMGIYDTAILEYRRYQYNPWDDIENNKMPKTYEKREQYGDKFREMCLLMSKFAGMRTSYEGIESVKDDYFDTPENRANGRSTGRTANRLHIITIHFPFSMSIYGDEQGYADKLNKLKCIRHMLERFRFHKVSEEKKGDEIVERYGISEYQTRHDETFKDRMDADYYKGYIRMFTLGCGLGKDVE